MEIFLVLFSKIIKPKIFLTIKSVCLSGFVWLQPGSLSEPGQGCGQTRAYRPLSVLAVLPCCTVERQAVGGAWLMGHRTAVDPPQLLSVPLELWCLVLPLQVVGTGTGMFVLFRAGEGDRLCLLWAQRAGGASPP